MYKYCGNPGLSLFWMIIIQLENDLVTPPWRSESCNLHWSSVAVQEGSLTRPVSASSAMQMGMQSKIAGAETVITPTLQDFASN